MDNKKEESKCLASLAVFRELYNPTLPHESFTD